MKVKFVMSATCPTFVPESRGERLWSGGFLLLCLIFIPAWSSADELSAQFRQHGFVNVQRMNALDSVATHLSTLIDGQEAFPTRAEFDAYTRFHLAQAGIFDSSFWLSILRGKTITDTDLMTDVLPRINRIVPPHYYGRWTGVIRGETYVVVLLVHHAIDVQLKCVDGEDTQPQNCRLEGRIQRGYFQPRLLVDHGNDQVVHHAINLNAHRSFVWSFPEYLSSSEWSVEIIAENRTGPRVLAVIPFRNGKLGRLRPRLRLGKTMTENPRVALESRLRKYRARHSRGDLKRNEVLVQVARNYARHLSQVKVLSHRDRKAGFLRQRLAEVGQYPKKMSEILVSGPTALSAFGAIVDSPAHRVVLLDDSMTDIGLAHVDHYYVIIFARFLQSNREVR